MIKTKFQEFLEEKEIQVSKLSFATQIPYPTLMKYIRGTVPNPPMDRIHRIIEALNCDFHDIF